MAEKFDAMVKLGITNSRMKDFYDVWALAGEYRFEGSLLRRAVAETFGRRGTPLPSNAPLALTEAFSKDGDKQKQWRAFVRKGRLGTAPALDAVVSVLEAFLMPVARAASESSSFEFVWPAGGPWSS